MFAKQKQEKKELSQKLWSLVQLVLIKIRLLIYLRDEEIAEN